MKNTKACLYQLNKYDARLGAFVNARRSYPAWLCKQVSTLHDHQPHHYRQCRQLTSSGARLNTEKYWKWQVSSRPLSTGAMRPYIGAPYAYAFGRSDGELVYKTVGTLLEERAANDSSKPAVVSHHENIKKTFAELNEDVNKIAKAMHDDLGIRKGDVIGLWSCNIYRWVVVQYAAARIGAILCTVNPFYLMPELDYALRKGEVKALFLPGKNSPQEVVNNFHKIATKTINLKESANPDPLLLKHIISIDGDDYQQSEVGGAGVQAHSYDKLASNNNGDLDASITRQVSPDDPLTIMFTSGTTGKPKGACLSHFTIANNAELTTKSMGFGEKNVCVPLPFFHAFAGVLGAIAMTAAPFQMIIPCLKYNVKQVVESMNEHRATHILTTPTLAIDLLNYAKKTGIAVPTLRCLLAGGASVPVDVAHQFQQVMPHLTDFRIGYGATELGPCTTACRPDDTVVQKTETVGSPLDFVEVKIIDPTTKNLVKLGEMGEVLSRGFNTMLGYWKDPVKTNEAIDSARWYNSGDLGIMDNEGFIKIVGRTKEMIIVGGENVYPRELEELLHTHPEIEDAHVVGVPDKRKGEAICAWVKLMNADSKVTEDELREFCKKNISYFKVPQYFMIVDSFPLTATGKAQKFIMRDISIKKLGLES